MRTGKTNGLREITRAALSILSGKSAMLTAALLVLCCTLSACAKPQVAMVSRTAIDFMDTVSTITVPEGQADAAEEAFALCRVLDAQFSAHRTDGDIGRLNRAQGQVTAIAPDTALLLRAGQAYGDLSGGLFDITVAPVTLLWDFTAKQPTPPDPQTLAEAAVRVGYQRLTVTDGTATLPMGMGVDLGGIAKGYATDRAAQSLRDVGVASAIVNLGGCVVTVGSRPDGAAWRVGIRQPFAARDAQVGVVSVRDMAVVTAGVYERSFTLDGVLYHHILDPRTGMPCDTDLLSATILTKNAMDGDALSTICILLGEKDALALLRAIPGTEAILVRADGSVATTPGIGKTIPFEKGE